MSKFSLGNRRHNKMVDVVKCIILVQLVVVVRRNGRCKKTAHIRAKRLR